MSTIGLTAEGRKRLNGAGGITAGSGRGGAFRDGDVCLLAAETAATGGPAARALRTAVTILTLVRRSRHHVALPVRESRAADVRYDEDQRDRGKGEGGGVDRHET